jgi:CheY-like chemotaxis protein
MQEEPQGKPVSPPVVAAQNASPASPPTAPTPTAQTPQAEATAGQNLHPLTKQPIKIFIIEDDQFYLKIYKKKFEVDGYQVEIASNGEEGLAKMGEFKPDIVLLDIMMPKLDGFDVLDKMKADARLKDVPVIMMTNLSTQEDMEKAKQKGAVDYIVKSDVTPSQVVTQIKANLQPKAVVPAK